MCSEVARKRMSDHAKSRVVYVVSVLNIAFFIGCDQSDHTKGNANINRATTPLSMSPISVEGEVYQGAYTSFGSSANVSPVEYRVKFTISNDGSAPVVFDEIKTAFIPQNGKSLGSTIQKTQGESLDPEQFKSGDVLEDSSKKPWILEPGKSEEFQSATNGYTSEILLEAGDEPVQFAVHVFRDNEPVAGPFYASLPKIESLPSFEATLVDKDAQKGKRLSFFR